MTLEETSRDAHESRGRLNLDMVGLKPDERDAAELAVQSVVSFIQGLANIKTKDQYKVNQTGIKFLRKTLDEFERFDNHYHAGTK